MKSLSLLTALQAACLTQALPLLEAQTPNDVLAEGVQSLPSPTEAPGTIGIVHVALETAGHPHLQPFATIIVPSPSSTLSIAGNSTIAQVKPLIAAATVSDIFASPISTNAPPSVFGSRPDHPVEKLGITNQGPTETNKFYANFFLGGQLNPVWTHPYSLLWSQGGGNAFSYGLSITHDEASQRAYGPNATANPVEFYINPIGIQSLIFSAAELGPGMSLSTDTLTAFSANVNLVPSGAMKPAISFPMVQGMGFVTAIYDGATPYIDTSVFFNTITPLSSPSAGVTKYKLLLDDGNTWLLYATATNGSGLALTSLNATRLEASGPFTGIIQVAKNPGDVAAQEASYDSCAGAYATTATLSASVNGASGSYTLSWTKVASNGASLMMMALPHHMQSMDSTTGAGQTSIQLQTTTKGLATGVIGDSWTMVEPSMPVDIGFAPWNAKTGSTNTIPAAAMTVIDNAGISDLSQDMNAQSNLNSMYYSGKALAKFAAAIYAVHDLAGDVSTAQAGLAKLEEAYERFANNTQIYPLVYESQWGGVVSTASYDTGNSGDDFGNTYYNDHHFHWSYFVYAASIIAYLDPAWLPAHQDWVNTLVRDASNPSTDDSYFPVSRSFDWYHGHSWAKGLFESGDGKDQESTSEDALFSYAMKMWGNTIGDTAMEARGNLMLAVQKRSFQNYFLLESTNVNQPANFIANKVTGILFENKVDHTTYFGANDEYIQGIHMIPINPSSGYIRNQNFVTEEWNTYFCAGCVDPVNGVTGGWRGILYSNLALIDPVETWDWLTGPDFDPQYLDDGASRTWYLALAAGMGGAG